MALGSWGAMEKGIIVAFLATCSLGVSAGGPKVEASPNCVLITVDTLRADHVSCYSAKSPVTTTAMDSLARDGVQFLNAATTNPLTTPAHASLMTGTWPMEHGVRDFTGYILDQGHATLAESLRAEGWIPAAFVSAAVLDHRTGMGQGFEVYDDDFSSFRGQDSRVAQRSGRVVIDRAKAWLADNSEKPFFLWIHLFEPHDPYLPPEPYKSRFQGNPYAGEVAYADALIEDFLSELKRRGLYEDSLVVVLSDHGEGLGDHGESKHGFFLYRTTMHIPWIMKLPGGQVAGRKVKEDVSMVDVFPTVLQALGIPRTLWPETIQGRSRFSLIHGGTGRPELVYMESRTPLSQFGWSPLRAIQEGGLKFIEAPRPELYDVEADPGELTNLFQDQQAVGLGFRENLKRFEARFQVDDPDSSGVDPELQEQLRSLGYVGLGSPVQASNFESLADPKDKIGIYEKMQRGVEAARDKDWVAAVRELTQAARLAPESPAIVSSLALAYRDSNQVDSAVEWFGRLFELTPDDLVTRMEFAQYLLSRRRVSEARIQLDAILSKDSQHFLALFNRGVLAAQSSDFEGSARFFERALEVKEDSQVLRSLALAKMHLSRWEEAKRYLLRALEMNPGDRRSHQQLSEVYSRLGDSEKARRHAQLAGRQ